MIQKDQVFHRPVIAFDLPLGHRMIGFGPDVVDFIGFEIASEFL